MGLRVFTGKNNFSKPDEGIFFYQFAQTIKELFEDGGYDGILLGTPITKGQSERYFPVDAVLFAKNAIIAFEFKSHGGVITTPTTDEEYDNGQWHTDRDTIQDKYIKGGSKFPNPYAQVQSYKRTLKNDVLFNIPGAKDSYINTGVVFYGNDIDISKTYIPDKMASNFFIASNSIEINPTDHYYYKIKSILKCKQNEKTVKLSDNDLVNIRLKFDIQEELTDDELNRLAGISKEELDSEIQNIKDELEAKEKELETKEKEIKAKDKEIKENRVELRARWRENKQLNRTISQQKDELADKDKTNSLLAEKNLDLINELNQKVQEIEELRKKESSLSPEQAERIEQIYFDVKNLKIRDFKKEISEDLEQKINSLGDRIDEIKKDVAANNIFFIPERKSKLPWIIVSTAICALIAVVITIIIAKVIDSQSDIANTIITIEKPDNLDGPYTAYVVDGDTIYVYNENKEKKDVRLLGIDAPAIKNAYEDTECFGYEAKSFLIEELHKNNSPIYLEKDDSQDDTDVYGRLLRYVWVDNEMINLNLLLNGYAKASTYSNNYKYKKEFDQAQIKAKRNDLGLWINCTN